MIMHAPVLVSFLAVGQRPDATQHAQAKYLMGGKGQFPTIEAQLAAFETVVSQLSKAGMRPMTKREYVTFITGDPDAAFGAESFVPHEPGSEIGEHDMHAPVSLELAIYITDGRHMGEIEVSVGNRGCFLSQAFIKAGFDQIVADSMPEGYRLMTKREFYDYIMAEATGSNMRFAMSGADDFEAIH